MTRAEALAALDELSPGAVGTYINWARREMRAIEDAYDANVGNRDRIFQKELDDMQVGRRELLSVLRVTLELLRSKDET